MHCDRMPRDGKYNGKSFDAKRVSTVSSDMLPQCTSSHTVLKPSSPCRTTGKDAAEGLKDDTDIGMRDLLRSELLTRIRANLDSGRPFEAISDTVIRHAQVLSPLHPPSPHEKLLPVDIGTENALRCRYS